MRPTIEEEEMNALLDAATHKEERSEAMSKVKHWESLMAARDAAEKDPLSMPLYEKFFTAVVEDDHEEGPKAFNCLLERYMLSSTEAREVIDDVLVAVCGWSMPSLAKKAAPDLASQAYEQSLQQEKETIE